MGELWQEARYALRALRRDGGFTAVVVLTLAIGIGANTAVFSAVREVLLEPLPYERPDRLTMVWSSIPDQGLLESPSGYANIQDWKSQNGVFEDLAVFDPTSLTLNAGLFPEQIGAAKVSANLFEVLGVAPTIGRLFTADEERGRAPVVVLSEALWQRQFNGSVDAIGQTVELAGTPFQVIGVMPQQFGFPGADTQLWVPLSWFTDVAANSVQRGTGPWRVIGRLRDGVSIEQAGSDLSAIARGLEQRHPDSNRGLAIHLVGLHEQVTGRSLRVTMWMLFAAVGVVLLIACANAAHMIVVRSLNRGRELAIRVALGAEASRLMGHALAEGLMLSGAAALLGIALAVMGLQFLVGLVPANVPRLEGIAVDGTVLGYAAVLSVIVGVVFGLLPVLGSLRAPFSDGLREGRNPSGRTRGHRVRSLLVTLQFSLAIVLVFGATVLVRSLLEVRRVEPGFRAADVLMGNLSVEPSGRRLPFYDAVVRQVAQIPGVTAAGIVEDLFISGAPNQQIRVEGSAEVSFLPMRSDAVAGDFFQAIDAPMREGRLFADTDGSESPAVAIINEMMARRLWPGESPVGRRFRIGAGSSDASWIEVVGVVGDMRRQGPEVEPIAQVFRPYAQAPSRNMILLVLAERSMGDLSIAVRTTVAAIDRTVPLYRITAVDQTMARYVAQRRFQTVLLGLFAGVALILAAVGVHGLISYSVSQRTRELGVRMALGGTKSRVVWMVLRQGLGVALQGLAVGVVCALFLSKLVSALFFGAAGADLANVLSTAAILLMATLLACYLPARRAAAVEPMVALRE